MKFAAHRLVFAASHAPIAIVFLTDDCRRRRALLARDCAMLLTLALSYLHALWAFRSRAPPVSTSRGPLHLQHHITQKR